MFARGSDYRERLKLRIARFFPSLVHALHKKTGVVRLYDNPRLGCKRSVPRF